MEHWNDEYTDEQLEAMLARAHTRAAAREAAEKDTQAKKANQPSFTFPKLNPGELAKPYVTFKGDVAVFDASRGVPEKDRKQADVGVKKIEDPVVSKKLAREQCKATAGKNWYDMPKTEMTPQLKRDLQLLNMRNVLDPHRHYKKESGKMKAPEYSQVGTIVEGPTEFFTGRIENKKRKQTLVEEVLSREKETQRFKSKYGELQGRKTSGKKAFYKELQAKRKGGVKKFSKS